MDKKAIEDSWTTFEKTGTVQAYLNYKKMENQSIEPPANQGDSSVSPGAFS